MCIRDSCIRDVAVDEFKRLGERLDVAEIAPLELRVIKRVEVVERPDGVAVAQEPFANVRADEARAAGDQKVHGQTLTTGTRPVERGRRLLRQCLDTVGCFDCAGGNFPHAMTGCLHAVGSFHGTATTSLHAVNSFYRVATASLYTETSCHRTVTSYFGAVSSFHGTKTSSHGAER